MMELRSAKNKVTAKKMPKTVKIILIIFLFGFVGFGIFAALAQAGYISAFKTALKLQKQQSVSVEDAKILEQLNKIMVLPEGVTPTMAIITNADALKNQQPNFFANAKNGDRLIVYPDKAIIYDFEANKIIQVGPVQTVAPQQSLPPSSPESDASSEETSQP